MTDNPGDRLEYNGRQIVRCVSCDGYGWVVDEFTGEESDCDWCHGTGYVYRDASGVDQPIPEAEYGKVADLLERLEEKRLREMGYSGSAVHPDEQPIRRQDQDEDNASL
jgi:hypothetical protein